ncbi:MAG: YafY family transcriptional regulator [Clostridia bacterium]|nr:YafY family transcriptional regulator [Clostridia bacterium]
MQVNNRLFEIVYILMQKKKVTAKELAKRFEVSTRTIYRDVEVLSGANIPIYASKGKDGGIEILDEYILNKTILSEKEQNQILFALQGMEKVGGQDEKEERFEIIKSAILNKNIIRFNYYNSNGEESKRVVEPLQIWFKDKSWYLISYCIDKEDYRVFKITRIREIEILEEHTEKIYLK